MNSVEQFRECGCCKRVVDTRTNEWDGIYGCCSKCAWCSSLEHFEPCHHGECMDWHDRVHVERGKLIAAVPLKVRR